MVAAAAGMAHVPYVPATGRYRRRRQKNFRDQVFELGAQIGGSRTSATRSGRGMKGGLRNPGGNLVLGCGTEGASPIAPGRSITRAKLKS